MADKNVCPTEEEFLKQFLNGITDPKALSKSAIAAFARFDGLIKDIHLRKISIPIRAFDGIIPPDSISTISRIQKRGKT